MVEDLGISIVLLISILLFIFCYFINFIVLMIGFLFLAMCFSFLLLLEEIEEEVKNDRRNNKNWKF